jgi:RNA polymerase-binding transcription factor DksA
MQEYFPIREQLTRRYDELRERLERVKRSIRHTHQPLDADFAEQAVQRENDEVLDALDGQMRGELQQIKATLARFDEGRYGLCVDCGQPIPARRLEILPHATQCVRCAELLA